MRVTAVQLATASAHAATLNEAAARLVCLEKLGLIMTAGAVILNRKQHPSFSLAITQVTAGRNCPCKEGDRVLFFGNALGGG
jgi:hypothetical protein